MDRGQVAAAARCWASQAAPADMGPSLDAILADWERGNLPAYALWRFLAKRFTSVGLLDPAREAGIRALEDAPDQPELLLEQARMELAAGASEQARDLAETIPPDHPLACDALLVIAEISDTPDADLAAEITLGLMARRTWTSTHEQGLRLLRRWQGADEASKFLFSWIRDNDPTPESLALLATILLETGRYDHACPILANLWNSNAEDLLPLIGPAPGVSSPAPAPEVQDVLHRSVLAALSLPQSKLATFPLPETSQELPSRILYVGPAEIGAPPNTFPNDLAEHWRNAAQAAGCRLEMYCDPALTGPGRPRLSDQERASRIKLLVEHLRATQPQVLILDCCWTLMRGDLDPRTLIRVKAETGTRLLCMFRDAQTPAMPLIRYWAEAADGIVLFDPLSPVFLPENADLALKAQAFPVPARHGPPPPPLPRHGLTFIGGLGQLHRPILIGALLATGLDVTAIIGERRAVIAPDMTAYGAILADSHAVLNIAVHSDSERLITGRVWETIAAGGLLLEQTGSGTPSFFTPYRHYLPWSSADDIIQAFHFLKAHPDLRQAMITSAQDWSRRHYGPDKVWRALMSLAASNKSP